MPTIITAPRVITGERDLRDAWIAIDGDRIIDVGEGASPNGERVEHDGWLLPGFVDIHVHGGGGAAFSSDDVSTVTDFHAAHGTTTMLASLVTEDLDVLETQVRRLVPHVEAGDIAGIHLEGPFLAVERRGAHAESALCDPDLTSVRRLLDAGQGTIRQVTIAPERVGAIDAITTFVNAGVTVAIGHSAADAAVAVAAVDAGATLVTHMCNGMNPLHHRSPGLIDVALRDSRLTCELILDGIHVSAEMLSISTRLCEGRWIAVTDAVLAAGAPDGVYRLGGVDIVCADGQMREREGGALAGSGLTMDRAFSYAVDRLGITPLEAARATAMRPARVISRSDIGVLAPGARADVVLWNNDGVHRVMRRGSWVA